MVSSGRLEVEYSSEEGEAGRCGKGPREPDPEPEWQSYPKADSKIQSHEKGLYNVIKTMNTTTLDTKAALHGGLGIRRRCSGLDVAVSLRCVQYMQHTPRGRMRRCSIIIDTPDILYSQEQIA